MCDNLPYNINDLEYKYIFSNKSLFLRLLGRIGKIKIFNELTEENLELVDKNYVLPDFSEQESDLLYKARLQEEEVFFYILFEHQSTVDYNMAMRLLFYITDIWRDWLKQFDKNQFKNKSFEFPPVVPIVLYDGDNPWTAIVNLKERIMNFEMFGKYIVDFEYILIDLNNPEEMVFKYKDVLSLILKLNKVRTGEELERLFLDLNKYLQGAKEKEINTLRICLPAALKELGEEKIQEARDILEYITGGAGIMPLFQNLRKIREEWYHEGIQKGIQDGLQQGLQQGLQKKELEIAEKMIVKGYSDEEIHEITGLDIEKIKELRAKHNN
ncbi:Rpn family recombination-promoting nuclease/putative transposase [Caldicellulosiruptor naganoensis]|uniref:Rpn family recombination-promoting nuclease/putative transposase n=1 Tax=Caldicellulosiruptor naganoensis TaxID=29324 RepID=A0ABY7BK35_9FIRM|nr:Rpn family recombination-promoting nuclease/putative transposase [Caldicellulosiruptor naganoensis]WAM31396.1 Rpn family recombination-promoting nuclease/putative transposase [Caldicellulosiruptor naganoensis]